MNTDLTWWDKQHNGEDSLEQIFVNNIVPRLKDDNIIINYGASASSCGLLYKNQPAVLNAQQFPLFRNHIDFHPQWTATVPESLCQQYQTMPGLEVFFWVKWQNLATQLETGEVITIAPVEGVWQCNIQEMIRLIASSDSKYNDLYCIDLRKLRLRWLCDISQPLYCIHFPDSSYVNVVAQNATIGEIDENTVLAVQNIIASFPGAKVQGSISEFK